MYCLIDTIIPKPKERIMNAMLRNLARLTVVLTITLTCSSTFGQATLTTDKPDYAPQSTATIYGTGFEPGEDVVVQVLIGVKQVTMIQIRFINRGPFRRIQMESL